MNSIGDIQVAEREAARIRTEAQQKADSMLQKAKEDALRIARQNDADIVSAKDLRTRVFRKTVEDEVKKMLAAAQKTASGIRSQTLDRKELEKLVDIVLAK